MAHEDRVAICERKHAYCCRLDATDADAFVDCFVDDAELDVSVYGTARGEAELREFVAWVDDAVAHSAHLVANPILEIDGDAATATWYYVVILEYPDGEVEFGQGRYYDEFRCVQGEWKLETVRAERAIGVPIA
jgi:ketosteroid isomerase-like protein